MKRIIEIKNITLGDADQYNAQSYPSPGIYQIDKDLYNTFFIANGLVFTVPTNQIISELYSEPKEAQGISAEILLKALAIAQKPELAIDLTKQQ